MIMGWSLWRPAHNLYGDLLYITLATCRTSLVRPAVHHYRPLRDMFLFHLLYVRIH